MPDSFYHPALIGGAGDTELAYAAGCAVFEELLENGLLEHIANVSEYLKESLNAFKNQHEQIKHICCKGLAVSMEFHDQIIFETVQKKMKESGLIVGSAENNKIILRPPYVIKKKDIDEVMCILERIFIEAL